jgi:hypothetical protein
LVSHSDVLALVGGAWHDFDGFLRRLRPWLGHSGFSVRDSRDASDLGSLDGSCRIVVLYTCLDGSDPAPDAPARTHSLSQWVSRGGGLLAIHSATVAARTDLALRALLGGVFVSHPPKASFRVTPANCSHPVTRGVGAFEVEDELYLHEVDPSVNVLFYTEALGRAIPLAWTRSQGLGKVVYFALGHDEDAWDLAEYRNIVVKSLAWLSSGAAD